MATYPLPGACDPVPPVAAFSADQSVLPPVYQAVFGDCNAAQPAIVASPRPRAPHFNPGDEDPAEIGQATRQPSVPTRFRGRLLDDADEEFCYPESAAFPPVASATEVAAAGNDLASADCKGATLPEPKTNIVPVNGDPGDSDVTKPARIPGINGLLATHAVTDKEPTISSEPIALIKAIAAESVATEGEFATYMITLTHALPHISTSQLVELGVVAVQGFRVKRLFKATILSEAKMRFAGEGKAERKREDEVSEALDKLESPDFCISIKVQGAPQTPPSGSKL